MGKDGQQLLLQGCATQLHYFLLRVSCFNRCNMIDFKSRFRQLKCCVIIPTYNNGTTLSKLISEVFEYVDDIIVVNDGSTDNTARVLANLQKQITVIQHPLNRGKGIALRNAFAEARKMGFDHAISIDSDGQHFASDLPAFLEILQNEPGSLVIGSRNMEQKDVPAKSSYGNQCSNFWFKVETGIPLKDTQSGYRLYPIKRLEGLRFITRRFEFEIEVIVKAAWQNIPVKNMPVRIHYATGSERITHFKPIKDIAKISLLHAGLLTIGILYYIPRRFFKAMIKKNANRSVKRHFFDLHKAGGPR